MGTNGDEWHPPRGAWIAVTADIAVIAVIGETRSKTSGNRPSETVLRWRVPPSLTLIEGNDNPDFRV
jgi:hypothetical protein